MNRVCDESGSPSLSLGAAVDGIGKLLGGRRVTGELRQRNEV
jgi:hypothetical protein